MSTGKQSTAVLCSLTLICGCTITHMQQGIKDDEVRISVKEAQLHEEEARQAKLLSEITSTQADLRNRNLSLQEINAKLSRLRTQNAATSARTAEGKRRKQRIDEELGQHQGELKSLEQQTDLSIAEKQAEKARLQEEIRKNLLILQNM